LAQLVRNELTLLFLVVPFRATRRKNEICALPGCYAV